MAGTAITKGQAGKGPERRDPSDPCSFSEMRVSQNYGYLIAGPHNKDCSIGSILGSLSLQKLPDTTALRHRAETRPHAAFEWWNESLCLRL